MNEKEFLEELKSYSNIEKIISDYHWCQLIDETNNEENLDLYDDIEAILYLVRDYIKAKNV
jgi:hypothetical protein